MVRCGKGSVWEGGTGRCGGALTRYDHDVPVFVPVVGAVAASAVPDGELGHLAADLQELALVVVELVTASQPHSLLLEPL